MGALTEGKGIRSAEESGARKGGGNLEETARQTRHRRENSNLVRKKKRKIPEIEKLEDDVLTQEVGSRLSDAKNKCLSRKIRMGSNVT